MSTSVQTDLGRLHLVRRGDGRSVLLQVPGCGKLELLDERQLAGDLSVDHAAVCGCGYHETHPFGVAMLAAMRARVLMGDAPTEDIGPGEYDRPSPEESS